MGRKIHRSEGLLAKGLHTRRKSLAESTSTWLAVPQLCS